jgi:hypothetical protein
MRGYVGVGGEVIVSIDDLSPVVLDDGRERMAGGCCGMPIFAECIDDGSLNCLVVNL